MLSQLKLKTHRILLAILFPLLCFSVYLFKQPAQYTPETQASSHLHTQSTTTTQDPTQTQNSSDQPLIFLFDNDHHGHILENPNGEYGLAARKPSLTALRPKL